MLRTDKGFAMLAGLICAAQGIKAKDTGEVMKASDFDVWGQDEEPDATPEQMVAELMKGPRNG